MPQHHSISTTSAWNFCCCVFDPDLSVNIISTNSKPGFVLVGAQVVSPATCKNCLSVGASSSVNQQYRWLGFVNYFGLVCWQHCQNKILFVCAYHMKLLRIVTKLLRRAVTIRDPMKDICSNCSSPHQCSQWVAMLLQFGTPLPKGLMNKELTFLGDLCWPISFYGGEKRI